jgi:hypothetical protein
MGFLERLYKSALATYFHLAERGHSEVYYIKRLKGLSKQDALEEERKTKLIIDEIYSMPKISYE